MSPIKRPIPADRRERRAMFKREKMGLAVWDHPEVKGLSWSQAKVHYKPSRLPIELGINQYKNDNLGDSDRIAYYKEEMWKTFNSLRAE